MKPDGRRNGLATRVAVVTSVISLVLLGVIGFLLVRGESAQAEPLTAPTTQPQDAQPTPSTEPTGRGTPATGGESPELTQVQKRAAADARFNLELYPQSRTSLIEHLTTRPEPYTVDDATVAVDSLGVDWDRQAQLSAESYIENGGWPKNALIEHLSSDVVGFTDEQATEAVEALDVDWSIQPERYARKKVDISSYSRSYLMTDMTEYVGFTETEAENGIDAADIDFNKEAADAAETNLDDNPSLTCDELIKSLTGRYGQGFTEEEAAYGAGTTSACNDPQAPAPEPPPTTTHPPVSPADWTPAQHETYDDAQRVLAGNGISRALLIETLTEDYFHANEDATIVVDSLRIDWNAEALSTAELWIQFWPHSKQGMTDTLVNSLFSEEQARFAADSMDVDWKANAAERATMLLEANDELTCEDLVKYLIEDDHFTPEEAQYGAEQAGIC